MKPHFKLYPYLREPRKFRFAVQSRTKSTNMSLLLGVSHSYKSTYNPYNAITVFGILWLQTNAPVQRMFPVDRIFDTVALSITHSSDYCRQIPTFREEVSIVKPSLFTSLHLEYTNTGSTPLKITHLTI